MKGLFLFIFSIPIFFVSCLDSSSVKERSNDVRLTYKIDYPKDFTDSNILPVLPNKLIVKLHDDKIKHVFKASFNVFSLVFISQSPKDSCDIFLKFLDKNLTYSISEKENIFLYDSNKNPNIRYVNEKTKIAGIICKKAIVEFPDQKPYSVFYTNKFKIKKPNRHTPYSDISGILTHFPLEFEGLKLSLTLTEINDFSPTEKDFDTPNNSIKSSEKEIKVMVVTLLKSFN